MLTNENTIAWKVGICWDITLEVTKLVFWLLHHNVLFLGILVCCQSGKHPLEVVKKRVIKSGYQQKKLNTNLKSFFYMFGYTMKTKHTNLCKKNFLPPSLTFGN